MLTASPPWYSSGARAETGLLRMPGNLGCFIWGDSSVRLLAPHHRDSQKKEEMRVGRKGGCQSRAGPGHLQPEAQCLRGAGQTALVAGGVRRGPERQVTGRVSSAWASPTEAAGERTRWHRARPGSQGR